MMNVDFQDRLTILVCSCDAYADLWKPFFTLLKKYWDTKDIPILLNTETIDFSFEGLPVECVHFSPEAAYGERMIHALAQIKTPYTLLLLDDFFIRKEVDARRIEEIIRWMDADQDIICFNTDPNIVYADWEINKYPGFRRITPGNNFALSMQAGIWRTEGLKKYWRPKVSPWEWETYCNVLTTRYPGDKFYCTLENAEQFIDYGHYGYGTLWGVVQGKWILEDVQPLFEKEGIEMDFSIRGDYYKSEKKSPLGSLDTRKEQFSLVFRSMGGVVTVCYFFFRLRNKFVRSVLGKSVQSDYFLALKDRAKNKFLLSR